MGFLKRAKQSWENIWMPQIPQSGKSELELERARQYETKSVWYHTILEIELLICNILLLWIAITLTLGLILK